MARRAHCSGEHLRRLCRKQLGRSPMQHVTYLRFRHAANLLTETDPKLEAIAAEIGYANAFVFSNSFKKWTGRRPSDYRTKAPTATVTPSKLSPLDPEPRRNFPVRRGIRHQAPGLEKSGLSFHPSFHPCS